MWTDMPVSRNLKTLCQLIHIHSRHIHITHGHSWRRQSRNIYGLLSSFIPRNTVKYFQPVSNLKGKHSLRTLKTTAVCVVSQSYHSGNVPTQQTIYAVSSGHGKCAVSVIRVSGPDAGTALHKLTQMMALPEPRKASLRTLYNPVTSEPLDRALLLWFPGPHSFTGEDCCEFQVHGGTAVVTAVLGALDIIPGLRHAEPGEYTRRAFSHGRLDLPEVEGLADLIHAETEAQRQQAFRQMGGELSRLYNGWRQTLVKCAANVAAYIDFSEDELIEDGVLSEVHVAVDALRRDILLHLDDNRRGERLRGGVHVAIIGEPNVGKSTMLNHICQRPAAIVSPMAGTTRDIVETALNIAGYPVLLSDTAGLQDTNDEVELEGVRRARIRADNADLRVLVVDARRLVSEVAEHLDASHEMRRFLECHLATLGFDHVFPSGGSSKPDNDRENLTMNHVTHSVKEDSRKHPREILLGSEEFWERTFVVFNKCDLVNVARVKAALTCDVSMCALSCVTEEGMNDFLAVLTEKVKKMCGSPLLGNPSLTQARHRTHLARCCQALDAYLEQQHTDLVLAGEQLRKAVTQLGKLTGKISTEEILDVVFRDFCIGK